MKICDMAQALIEIKTLLRSNGRTNFISNSDLDKVLVDHKINLKDLDRYLE